MFALFARYNSGSIFQLSFLYTVADDESFWFMLLTYHRIFSIITVKQLDYVVLFMSMSKYQKTTVFLAYYFIVTNTVKIKSLGSPFCPLI